jgi:hypothetical protein
VAAEALEDALQAKQVLVPHGLHLDQAKDGAFQVIMRLCWRIFEGL